MSLGTTKSVTEAEARKMAAENGWDIEATVEAAANGRIQWFVSDDSKWLRHYVSNRGVTSGSAATQELIP